jgi:holliday junction DNA helicase RuvB
LASLETNAVLFVDEIHRLPSHVEEVLYSAMDDLRLDLLIGQGPTARTVRFDLKPFTLIGATTRAGSLSAPLRSRFAITEHLEFYSAEDLCSILQRNSGLLCVEVDPAATLALAKRSRGTPRVANALLSRVMDFALVANETVISLKTVEQALVRLGVDKAGLGIRDRQVLRLIRDRHDGGPVGLEAVAAALSEDRVNLEDVYEPYLVHKGFVVRTARGRQMSQLARSHLADVDSEHGDEF